MSRRNQGPRLAFRAERGVYYIVWTEAGRSKRSSTGTGDIERAQEMLARFLDGRRAHGPGPADPSGYAVLICLENYGREHAATTAAPDRIGYAIDALATFWSGRVVADVTRETCRAYGRNRGVSAGTLRRELGTMRAAINHEVREGRLTRPVHVWLPAKPEGKDRWLSREEAASLLRATRQEPKVRLYLPLFVLIGLYTGARKEAILSLRWPQVDLERQRIDFNPPGRARTAKARPVIPIPRRLLTFLYMARKRGGDLDYVVKCHGRPVKDIKRAFGSAARRAGVLPCTPHTMRHTAGTWMAQRGVPLFEIAGYLGHSHQRTSELYSHHCPDHLERARRAFD